MRNLTRTKLWILLMLHASRTCTYEIFSNNEEHSHILVDRDVKHEAPCKDAVVAHNVLFRFQMWHRYHRIPLETVAIRLLGETCSGFDERTPLVVFA